MKTFLILLLTISTSSLQAGVKNSIHLNSRVEFSNNPATQLEVGEQASAHTVFYLGALLPNQKQTNFEETNISINMKYIYARLDIYRNTALAGGLYGGVILSYADAQYLDDNLRDNNTLNSVNGLGAGVEVGYTWNFKNITAGLSLKALSYDYETQYEVNDQEDLVLPHHESAAGLVNIGYRF